MTKQSIRKPAVYMMTNKKGGTIYTGVTSDLVQRVFQHREGSVPGFTSRYGCKILVYYEMHETMIGAIEREKQIKGGSRKDKVDVIHSFNAGWEDLYKTII